MRTTFIVHTFSCWLLFFGGPIASHAETAKAPRKVTKPISSITVKVVAAADFARKLATRSAAEKSGTWIVTTADVDSCTAWVSDKAPNVAAAEVAALRACRAAMDRAVDGAIARDEAKLKFPACTLEDASTGPSPCVWDCKTMANGKCGVGMPRFLVITAD